MRKVALLTIAVVLVALLASCASDEEVDETPPVIFDKTPPVIFEISASNMTETGAVITWTTSEPATSQVEYGLTTGYDQTSSLDDSLTTQHSVTLSGLDDGTFYHFRVKSKDAADNEALSDDSTFNTLDVTPPVISNIVVSDITDSGVVITWTTSEPATSQVEYGLTTSYGQNTPLDESLVNNHSVSLRELTTNTTYHYRIKSKDVSGNEALSGDYVFIIGLGLYEAEASGLVRVNISGRDSLSSILIDLESVSDDPIQVLILPGTIFEAQSAGTQDMVATRAREAFLSSYGSIEAITVPAACANMELGMPGESDFFTIGSAPAPEDLLKLSSISEFFDESFRVRQFAIWTITDNPNDRSEYVAISSGILPWGTGPSESEMQRILILFIKAGISTDKYPALPEIEEEIEFQLTEWSFIDDYGTATLTLNFTTTGYVELILTTHDGVGTDSARVFDWETEAELELAGHREFPEAGEYILTVKDVFGKTIATETFNLVAQVTISEVSLAWDYWRYSDSYSLEGISFKVTNNGDLPVYIDDYKISIDGTQSTRLIGERILPGEESTFDKSLYLSEITPGDKALTLELMDIAGKVIGSYSATVTPLE